MREKFTKPIIGGKLLCLKKLVFTFIFLLLISQTSFAQSKKITLNMKNAKRTAILNEVKKQVDMEFFYNVKELDKYGPLSINVKNESITEVIKLLIKDTNLKYTIDNNVVNILLVGETTKAGEYLGLMLNVSGKITDEDGNPLPGASIRDSKNEHATTSNNNGDYSINVRRGSMLIFSYVGAEAFKTSINAVGVTEVKQNVQLNTSANVLNEVTVSTGYQDITKRNMVGSIATVKADDIKAAGIRSIDQLLQGQLAGVSVANQTGIIGSSPKVRVRGTSTLLGNQEPVWVVDGIIQQDRLPFDYSLINTTSSNGIRDLIGSSVSFLNIEDIQDISVLKDASATAIYGTKAANGVIVITTKKGKAGPARFNYVTNLSISGAPSYDDFNLMNSKERIDVSKEIYARGLSFQFTPDNLSYEGYLTKLLNKTITQEQFNTQVGKLETMNTDWFGLLYQNPFSQNHSLSVSGGTDKIRYYASMGYANNRGNTIGNGQDTYNGNLSINVDVSKKLKLGFRLGGNMGKTTGFYQINPFNYAFNTSRTIPAYNEDGSYYAYKKSNDFAAFSILNERDHTGNKNKSTNFSATTNLDYKFLKDFTFQSLLGITYTQTNGESYAAAQSYYIGQNFRMNAYNSAVPGTPAYAASYLPQGGVLNTTGVNNQSYTFRNTIAFNKSLRAKKDNLMVLVGSELKSSIYDGLTQTNFGYMPERGRTFAEIPITYLPTNIGSVPLQSPLLYRSIPGITDQKANFVSYFGTATYNWDNRYVVNATIRTDASNRFGQSTNNRFLPIWSAGIKWNVMEEGFFSDKLKWLSQFSIRGTYGFQGNVAENFGPELILRYPTRSISTVTGEGLLNIKSLGYPDLRWEKTATVNLGLDFAFLSNRISGSVDYYNKKTTDALAEVVIPVEYGVATMPVNAGNINNHGYELYLNFVPVSSRNFTWAVNFNTARNFNQVTKSGNNQLETWNALANGTAYIEGYAASSFFAFNYKGLDPVTGYPTFNIPTLTDASKKNVSLLMDYAGQLDPKFTGGFGTNIRYKSFSLNSSFTVSVGAQKFLAPLYNNSNQSAPYPTQNLSSILNDRWRKPGDEAFTNIPSLPTANISFTYIGNSSYPIYSLYDYSTVRVVDADYLRCRNIGLTYAIPPKMLAKAGIQQCSLQASVTNLFYIASGKLEGIDPEVSGNNLPIPRTYSLTLNVGF
ncbi:SusC/RagA family TonB-linked outer membrane protein [Pedobacter nyackensis]|uniref:TonB-linked outer membrane protein, SusC/RagA family n=1 Tax=Pedobacter nyackensis TaxID=475255 RepID=A0A1W2F0B0_9SPHI|nr:SusC/RagA family TonB-linked outer membrane protein [Pedobacter nyackensis]SMD15379.1 TonB-linked outer membrane protein, SusC/RagA family [Pedobacter nyackensis]